MTNERRWLTVSSIKNYYERDMKSLQQQCEKSMLFHIIVTLKNGSIIDGIIEKVEPDYIVMLVGEDVMQEYDDNGDEDRQVSGYGRPRRRFRRFRRRRFPLGALAALSLLQYPYPPHNQYPYNYYYPNYDYDDDYDYDHDDYNHHHHGHQYGPYNPYY